MDAVDGKHARNTGRASPLGQLIDHGLDCFSYCFSLISVISGQKLGFGYCTLIYQFFVYSVYFSHTWEEYYTGTFSTQVDNVGGTEFQFLAAFLILTPVLFGTNLPYINLIYGFNICEIFSFFILILGILHVHTTVSRALPKIPSEKKKECLIFFFPLFVYLYTLVTLQFSSFYKSYPLETIVLNGLVFSYLSAEQILATCSKSNMILFQTEIILYALVTTISLLMTIELQFIVFCLFSVSTVFKYSTFVVSAIVQMMNFLNINF